jgi:hypothetical protein
MKSLRKSNSNDSLDLSTMLLISIKTSAKNASHYLIDFRQVLLHGLKSILLLSKKLSSMFRHCPVLAFQLFIPLRSLRLMPPTLDTMVFSNNKSIPYIYIRSKSNFIIVIKMITKRCILFHLKGISVSERLLPVQSFLAFSKVHLLFLHR